MGVRGFPTLIFFPVDEKNKGEYFVFKGRREIEKFVEFSQQTEFVWNVGQIKSYNSLVED